MGRRHLRGLCDTTPIDNIYLPFVTYLATFLETRLPLYFGNDLKSKLWDGLPRTPDFKPIENIWGIIVPDPCQFETMQQLRLGWILLTVDTLQNLEITTNPTHQNELLFLNQQAF